MITPDTTSDGYANLASYRHCTDRITGAWPAFSAQRRERLRQGLFGSPVEKIAENILEDLFTQVLDWTLADVNLQVGRADIILSELGIKRLVLEVKRPGSLLWHRRAIEAALAQALGYAASQKVGAIAVSDGHMLYAADIVHGGLHDRLFVSLESATAPLELWWVSVHGIYRPCPKPITTLPVAPTAPEPGEGQTLVDGELLQPKYRLPARCFAYLGKANVPSTWKLPYLMADGTPDQKRLPKAIQAILSNYRGAKVSIPREAVADVLVRLAETAAGMGKMPCQCSPTADAYVEAHEALAQLGRLSWVAPWCRSASTGDDRVAHSGQPHPTRRLRWPQKSSSGTSGGLMTRLGSRARRSSSRRTIGGRSAGSGANRLTPTRPASSNIVPSATVGSPRSALWSVFLSMWARSARSLAVIRRRRRAAAICSPSTRAASRVCGRYV